MTNLFRKNLLWTAVVASLAFTGCREDDPEPVNEPEEINTVEFSLTSATGQNPTPIVITFRDLDGAGGNAPTLTPDSLRLAANTTYNARVRFLKEEAGQPVEDKTSEIEVDEPNDHEVFYTVTGANLTFSQFNEDKNTPPLKLGTRAVAAAGAASRGTVVVT
ncbi:MAG: hypothetical protein MUD08_11420, partial [Cytophagales bacterium]|nr:hypothetical protein [Cytophagales bacterium]